MSLAAMTAPPYRDGRPAAHPHSFARPEQNYHSWQLNPGQAVNGHNSRNPNPSRYFDNSLFISSADEEISDSDVSISPEHATDALQSISTSSTEPHFIPALGNDDDLSTVESVQARLHQLEQIEEANDKAKQMLYSKRARKDQRIQDRRRNQDKVVAAMYEGRSRKDDRIKRRRQTQDASFEQVYKQLDEAENDLRRRLKNMKRGIAGGETSGSGESVPAPQAMSPPTSRPFPTAQPPAKRHQSEAVGYPSAGYPPTHPRPEMNPPPQFPSYQFYESTPFPMSAPFPNGPPRPQPNNAPQPGPPPPPSQQIRYTPNEPPAQRPNGIPQGNKVPSMSTLTAGIYDTRPPPTTTGFASVNTPPASGFAPINAPSRSTPLVKPHRKSPKQGLQASRLSNDGTRNGSPVFRVTESGPNGTPNQTPGKRTPSTTHPYQMSEAFANRHHHCERVDDLNRGIWTSYGPGGTKDAPTGPPVEMHVRCNHDDCRRIDWRTIHGLQCHIVKNHEQPKGTIGSLEKALDKYGVPVKEVENYEKIHGLGSGGTFADPKNMKIKVMTKGTRRVSIDSGSKNRPGSTSTVNSASPYPTVPPPPRAPLFADMAERERVGFVQDDIVSSDEEDEETPVKDSKPPSIHQNRFEAITSEWPRKDLPSESNGAPKAISRNVQMQDAPPAEPSTIPASDGEPKVPDKESKALNQGEPATATPEAKEVDVQPPAAEPAESQPRAEPPQPSADTPKEAAPVKPAKESENKEEPEAVVEPKPEPEPEPTPALAPVSPVSSAKPPAPEEEDSAPAVNAPAASAPSGDAPSQPDAADPPEEETISMYNPSHAVSGAASKKHRKSSSGASTRARAEMALSAADDDSGDEYMSRRRNSKGTESPPSRRTTGRSVKKRTPWEPSTR